MMVTDILTLKVVSYTYISWDANKVTSGCTGVLCSFLASSAYCASGSHDLPEFGGSLLAHVNSCRQLVIEWELTYEDSFASIAVAM